MTPTGAGPEVGDLGAYVVDDGGRLTTVNERALRLLALERAAVLGRDHHELLHRAPDGSTLPRAGCPLMDAVLARTACSGSGTSFLRGDGRLLPVHWTATPYPGGGPGATLVLFHPSAADALIGAPGTLTELERLGLLAETTTSLTSTMNEEETVDRLAPLVLPRLADWLVVDLVDETGDVRRARVVEHRDGRVVRHPGLEGPMPVVTQRSPLPLSRALRGGAASVAGPEVYRGEPDSGIAVVQRELFAATGMHSAAIAPIRGAREVLGALTLGRSTNPVRFATRDLSLLEDLTRRTGLAISNSRLYQRQRRVAETMQRHLLPQLPRVPGVELCARYLSAPDASQVGGDWYDAFALSEEATALVIGDVVGHDLEAAAGMAQLRNMLRALAWSQQGPPGRVVDLLDAAMGRVDALTTATLVLGRLTRLPEAGWRWDWTNAGHPPPLLVTADGRTEYLRAPRSLLLGTGARIARGETSVRLPPGCTLLLYTDGLVESRHEGIEPGFARLRRHAASLAHHGLEGFCDRVLERVRPPDNDDDVALLALRVPPEGR
ncbi:DNA-binding protein [Kitasatospora sp. MMS16-BH015]|uniref:SpoIIE family protein phosphatase n=1 Tax=Kitasatospora sp. MMS16-BH015 TaxID=2018025 RepID=UPI000CA30D9D|nr:SpoIIE family protein phosphatase [Kitasatospora sp. MMS16-BH015]AUG81678.1 DNA-binding protein [Kitasatospora sp. MMS16-BH015]